MTIASMFEPNRATAKRNRPSWAESGPMLAELELEFGRTRCRSQNKFGPNRSSLAESRPTKADIGPLSCNCQILVEHGPDLDEIGGRRCPKPKPAKFGRIWVESRHPGLCWGTRGEQRFSNLFHHFIFSLPFSASPETPSSQSLIEPGGSRTRPEFGPDPIRWPSCEVRALARSQGLPRSGICSKKEARGLDVDGDPRRSL